jgi:DNA-directed RNA polymerase specialized sigma24 family protein
VVTRSKTFPNWSKNKLWVLRLYIAGFDISEIAETMNLTQERVRQILLKIWRDNK